MVQINIDDMDLLMKLFGNYDRNIAIISEALDVTIVTLDSKLQIKGEPENEQLAGQVIEKLVELLRMGEMVDERRIRYALELVKEGNLNQLLELGSQVIAVTAKGRPIRCKTFGQKKYVQAIKENSVVVGVGPAGTGKTYLAVALAVTAYKNKEVERIILTRPAVEAGEKLGFLPGDLQNKVDPYLRPLYDALQEMFGLDNYQKLMERQVIEVAPLAYMRGRTLSNAFIILDEAQNTTCEQMKMFLTRIGEGSKMIVNGDITQIDLPEGKKSGLKQAMRILADVKDIAIVKLSARDVVRHELVQNIIKAYERAAIKPEDKKSAAEQ